MSIYMVEKTIEILQIALELVYILEANLDCF